MKYLFPLITVICLVLVLIYTDRRCQDIAEAQRADKMIYQQRIEQLEKEIRLLRTDLDIAQNGFDEK